MSNKPILVEISIGELFDKISILQIKNDRIYDEAKLTNIRTELAALEQSADQIDLTDELNQLRAELRQVNEKLWEIEDDIRACEKQSEFGDKFIQLARSVYITNDQRAVIKRQINELAGSRLVEEKNYC